MFVRYILLTHWGRDKMAAVSQTTLSNAFSWMRISIKISLKFIPKGPINNIPALVQIMAWRRPGDKPLSEPMMDNLPTHICVTRPQWVMPVTKMKCILSIIFHAIYWAVYSQTNFAFDDWCNICTSNCDHQIVSMIQGPMVRSWNNGMCCKFCYVL